MGRPALQSFAAPTEEEDNFAFVQGFLRTENAENYYTKIFEDHAEKLAPVGTMAGTLGAYYSADNSALPYQDITPYPMARTVYSDLRPGATQAILGGNKIDGQWKQSYQRILRE